MTSFQNECVHTGASTEKTTPEQLFQYISKFNQALREKKKEAHVRYLQNYTNQTFNNTEWISVSYKNTGLIKQKLFQLKKECSILNAGG